VFETNRRYYGAAPVDSGNVAKMLFKSKAYTADSTIINFTITELTALDSLGNSILLPSDSSQVVLRGPAVWPGDTDDNGIVNQADLLPIGTYFNFAGPKRRNASIQWIGQYATRWQPKEATYADANGNGKVEVGDMDVVTINWGRTHGLSCPAVYHQSVLSRELSQRGKLLPVVRYLSGDKGLTVEIFADSLSECNGIAFELEYPANVLRLVAVQKGNVWDRQTLLIFKNEPVQDKVGIGICEPGMEINHFEDRSLVAVVQFAVKSDQVRDQSYLNFKINEALGIDHRANLFQLAEGAWDSKSQFDQLPATFLLRQNFPNPFNPGTRIEFSIPKKAHIIIKIHDILGREIKTLIDDELPPGSHFVFWDGNDGNNNKTPTGIYFIRMQAEGVTRTMKVVKVK